jgi:hypothetical protein
MYYYICVLAEMNKYTLLFFALLVVFSCKKKEEPKPADDTPPIIYGKVIVTVQSYDSLGQELSDNSHVRIKLGSRPTVTTIASGEVVFDNLAYGDYFPSILRDGWAGAPTKVTLNAPEVSVSVPIAQHSSFQAQNFTSQIVTKDSIIVSFKIDKDIPIGKSTKIGLIAAPNSSLKFNNYESADIFEISTNAVNNLNIAKFANFKSMLAGLDSNAIFYINVIPVSYGEYISNIGIKPQLLGENLFPPDNWLLQKDWK